MRSTNGIIPEVSCFEKAFEDCSIYRSHMDLLNETIIWKQLKALTKINIVQMNVQDFKTK